MGRKTATNLLGSPCGWWSSRRPTRTGAIEAISGAYDARKEKTFGGGETGNSRKKKNTSARFGRRVEGGMKGIRSSKGPTERLRNPEKTFYVRANRGLPNLGKRREKVSGSETHGTGAFYCA